MATVYSKTDNYGLNLYGDNDPADLRDGYNGSMRTIDTTLEKHLNRIEGVESRETHDDEVVKALLGDNTVDNATTAKNKWNKASTDAIEAMANAIEAMANAATATEKAASNSSILTALGGDTTDHAAASKTKWDKASADAIAVQHAVEGLKANVTSISQTAERVASQLDVTNASLSLLIQNHFITHNYGVQSTVRHGDVAYYGCDDLNSGNLKQLLVTVNIAANTIDIKETTNLGHVNDMAWLGTWTPSTPLWIAGMVSDDGTKDLQGIRAYSPDSNTIITIPVPLAGIAGITRDPVSGRVFAVCRGKSDIYEITKDGASYHVAKIGDSPIGSDFERQGIAAYNNMIFGTTTRLASWTFDTATQKLSWYTMLGTDTEVSRRIGEYEAGEFTEDGNLWYCARSIANDDASSMMNWGGWLATAGSAVPHTIGGHTAKTAQTIEITDSSLKPNFTTVNQCVSLFEIPTMVNPPTCVKVSTTLDDSAHGSLRYSGVLSVGGNLTVNKLQPTGSGALRVPGTGSVTITNQGTQIECSDRCSQFTYAVTSKLLPNDNVKFRNGGCMLSIVSIGNTGGLQLSDSVTETSSGHIYFTTTKIV